MNKQLGPRLPQSEKFWGTRILEKTFKFEKLRSDVSVNTAETSIF